MRTAIIALLSVFWLAAQSITVTIDVDGICPTAVITLTGAVPGDCDDDDYRKLHVPTNTFTTVYTDSSMPAASELGPRLLQESHFGKLPLYQLNAAWRI